MKALFLLTIFIHAWSYTVLPAAASPGVRSVEPFWTDIGLFDRQPSNIEENKLDAPTAEKRKKKTDDGTVEEPALPNCAPWDSLCLGK